MKLKKKKKKKKKEMNGINADQLIETEGQKLEKSSNEEEGKKKDVYVDRRTKSERRFDEVQVRRRRAADYEGIQMRERGRLGERI